MRDMHRLDRFKEYHDAVRKALLRDWDPIGIRAEPGAQDEYDSYVPMVCKLLMTGRPRHEVFDYLWWLETEHMGLVGDRQATEQFAEKLMNIPQEIERGSVE